MVVRVSLRRVLTLLAALFAAALVVTGTVATPAVADPDEGGSVTLRERLESAARGHIEAKNKLDTSKKRQLQLGVQLQKLEAELKDLNADVAVIAATTFSTGWPAWT